MNTRRFLLPTSVGSEEISDGEPLLTKGSHEHPAQDVSGVLDASRIRTLKLLAALDEKTLDSPDTKGE